VSGSGTGTPSVPGTPPSEPLTLNEARLHLRLITDPADATAHPDDAKISGLITAAREYAEQFCQRAFAVSTHTASGAGFDVALLPPVASIVSVAYLDSAGAEQTLAGSVYELNGKPDAPALRLKIGQSWPAIYSREDAVRVQYVAGVAPADVPYLVKAAMLLTVGHLDANREAVGAVQTFSLPMGVQSLLMPYRLGLGV